MGCGESKHSVATANAVPRHREKPAPVQNADSKNRKDVKSIPAAAVAADLTAQQPEAERAAAGKVISPADARVEPLPSSCEGEEEKMGKGDAGGPVQVEEEGRSINPGSPNQFFSSREDAESIGRVASERSVYFSPSHAAKEVEKSAPDQDEAGVVVEETKAVTENGEETGGKKEENVEEEDAKAEKESSESKDSTANDEV